MGEWEDSIKRAVGPIGREEVQMTPLWGDMAKTAVVSVGGGRGFALRTRDENLIVTAAHCLPEIPPACSEGYERTACIIGSLGAELSIFAECIFVDPVADIAVLGRPDGQVLENADLEWDEFLEKTGSLDVSVWRGELSARAWLLSLDGKWNPCTARQSINGSMLWIEEANSGIYHGMSGSPILTDDGKVVSLISIARGSTEFCTDGGPNPCLRQNLPQRLAERL